MPITDIYSRDFVATIVIGTVLFLMLISFCVAFMLVYQKRRKAHQEEKRFMEISFQQELLKTQLETQENTFDQMGRELHDNIGQLLSTIKLLLGIALRETGTIPDTLKTADQTVGKAINDLRLLSKSLSKEWLQQFNLIENVEAEKQRINAARNVEVSFTSDKENIDMKPESQVMLFRIVQEAMQNVVKYANAQHISIEMTHSNNRFQLQIKDDGKGFDVEAARNKSMGLQNMEYRTRLLGGTIQWNSETGKGTSIHITIPKT